MSPLNRFQRRYQLLRMQHRCVNCAGKLPENHTTLKCDKCSIVAHQVRNARKAQVEIKPGWTKTYAQRRSQGLCLRCGAQLSDYHATCLSCRQKLKARFLVPRSVEYREDKLPPVHEGGERCPRCLLLLPHEGCLPSIYELAAGRRGPGRPFPEGGP